MKNRVHDAPVKIIQILPVDNNSSHQPLKPSDFSFFKNLVAGVRETMAQVTTAGRRATEAIRRTVATRHQASATTDLTATEEARKCEVLEPSEQPEPRVQYAHPDFPVQRSDTIDLMASPPGWVERAPDIVVRDIVVIQEPSLPIEGSSAESYPADPMDNASALQPNGIRRRFEGAKAMIVSQWLREKEQIASARTAARTKLHPLMETAWHSLLAARINVLQKWGTMTHAVARPGRQIGRRVRKMTAQTAARMPAVEDQRDDQKTDRQHAARELTHELEVTKATLLAQQHALENVTVQLNAVQKELARHKSMLAGLMTQVEAVDLKIARAIHPPASRKTKSSESGPSRRAPAKKSSVSVERPREQPV